jgi:hypothetical protein
VGGIGFAAFDFLDHAAERALNNPAPIPSGNFPRGRELETLSGANLGGNVEAIDHFKDGFAASVRSHNQMEASLVQSIQRDLDKLDGIESRELRGTTSSGERIVIRPGDIRSKALLVYVPENHGEYLMSQSFRNVLTGFREFYKTTIRIIPVRGWRGR